MIWLITIIFVLIFFIFNTAYKKQQEEIVSLGRWSAALEGRLEELEKGFENLNKPREKPYDLF